MATYSSSKLLTIPTAPFEYSTGSLSLHDLNGIIVDYHFANTSNTEGETLIPPTLHEFAKIFANDLEISCDVSLPLLIDTKPSHGSIFLTLDLNTTFPDAAGRPSSEGYSLTVGKSGITIAGASPLGVWWGTRTLIQTAVLNENNIALGGGRDAPGWATRGIMLDAGRHYYPPEFLVQLCAWISFYKQNTFHLHLSDNLGSVYLDDFEFEMQLYSAFRLNSDAEQVAGLNRRFNESYTRSVFDDIQRRCAARGVTVIPEIETPGHSLVITQWKPELGLSTDYSMLNISHPSTIPVVKTIWSTFLPWFHSKTVHIGADEYSSSLIPSYNDFVNTISTFIRSTSNKATRIWGTFPPSPSYTNNISPAVSIQHWEFFEDDPLHDYIANNYSVLNSDDAFYIVNKWSGSYLPSLNLTRIFHGSPDGSAYAPNIFSTTNASLNPPRENPNVLGHIAPLWNDNGPNATVYSEAYYALKDGLPALADKQWGGTLLSDEYAAIIDTLHAAVPGQNLDNAIPTHNTSNTIFAYDFSTPPNHTGIGTTVPDLSGNFYDARLRGPGCVIQNHTLHLNGSCYLATPLTTKGRDYSLSFSVYPTSNRPGALFSSPTAGTALMAGNGSVSNVMMNAEGNAYLLNYTLPVGRWTDAKVVGDGNRTFFEVGDAVEEGEVERMEFTTTIGTLGNAFVWAEMGFEAPVERVGEGFRGMMRDVVLKGVA
ncbi:glycoside hydrolase family 20 protein [Saccharata proteae CBS 121410]|uniref:beta-N-acetylhexosaminidase n=1 Tax=Saccharata proteae CBS 121410 TaxID=1314787 RepID=A0A6A5YCV8_9PEZI|nr:glycoside hydrolase family 20 protein [Saccharata proteae CBS 121410]